MKNVADKDILGQRGEALFYTIMTRLHANGDSLFRPQFLGDKWPLVDFIVELQGVGATTPFFFVQVRLTRAGYTQRDKRLKVKADAAHVAGLTSHPAPTYLVGIDDVSEVGYIISVNGENRSSLSSLSTAYPVNEANREKLWTEVKSYWTAPQAPKLTSSFLDPDWK